MLKMSKHITNKEIYCYISGDISPQKKEEIRKHLELCQECRSLVNIINATLSEHTIDAIPSQKIKDAIIDEWEKIYKKDSQKKSPVITKKFLVPAFSFIFSIIFIAGIYLFYFATQKEETLQLTINPTKGYVTLNSSEISTARPISQKELIVTAENSLAHLESDDIKINIYSSTQLQLVSLQKISGFKFLLHSGSIEIKSHGSTPYEISCGNYNIKPAGTEFIVKFINNILTTAVTEGTVIITDAQSKIEIPSGKLWSSKNPEKLADITPQLLQLMQNPSEDVSATGEVEKSPLKSTMKNTNSESTTSVPDKTAKSSGTDQPHKSEVNEDEAKIIKQELYENRKELLELKKQQRQERKGRNH